MILHIFPDEKFIDLAIDNFEKVYPNKHKYLIGINNNDLQLKYVKKNLQKVQIASYYSPEFYAIIGNLLQYDAVVLHYLDTPKIDLIKKSPEGVNFVWNSWGGDIYNDLSSWRYKLFGPLTSKSIAYAISNNLIEYYIRISYPFKFLKNIKAELKLYLLKKTIRKISFLSTVITSEKIIIDTIFNLKCNYVPFNYFGDMFNSADYEKYRISGAEFKNILLGNSAAPTNNHIEAINLLSKFKFNEQKIYTPLSYGAEIKYIDKIKLHGTEKLGENFLPLDKILPFNEYFELISSCSVCIMNHYRQNGMGNVIFMLWIGSKVFLSEKNPSFLFLKNLGLIIYSIEIDIESNNNVSIFDSLKDAEKLNNKKIIEEQYGYDIILKRIRNFTDEITNKSKISSI